MDRMSDDEKIDTWIRDAAQTYHQPPAVPREAMWRVIQGALAPGGQSRTSSPRRAGRWPRILTLAVAAGALMAVGFQAGRRWRVSASDVSDAAATADAAPDSGGATYASAAAEHLASTEILLVAVRAPGRLDSALVTWARNLLSDTRLLLSSPVAADPARRRLLEDVELTLVELVQLSAAGDQDPDAARRSLDTSGLLTRLRTAIPARGQT
jgi:hypothetical protein